MDNSEWASRMDRLERILEKMATAAPPTVNVNVVLPDTRKKKTTTDPNAAISEHENDGHPIEPSALPRKYIS